MIKIVKENLFFISLFLFLFAYVLLRALWVPAYHDEINTFFTYVQTGEFQPFHSFIDQNNHILNTTFSHLFFLLFGENILVLRLANVLSFIMYMFFVWKIAKTFQSKLLSYAWFVTMGMSLYLISFFSLSRGYGMSIAFFTASVYYLIDYKTSFSNKSLLLGLFASVCAIWAYLGMMIPVLVLSGLYALLFFTHILSSKNFKSLKILVPSLLVVFVMPLLYAIKYSFYIKTKGTIYGSMDHDFIHAVLFNLTDEFSGSVGNMFGRLFLAFVLLVLLVSMGVIMYKKKFKSTGIYSVVLLLGTIAGTVALFYLFKVEYPTSRMGTYYYVLFMVPLYVAIDESGLKLARLGAYLVAGVIAIQFILTFNFSYAPCWRYETLPHSINNRIAEEMGKSSDLPTFSTYEILYRQFNAFDYSKNGSLNTPQIRNFPSKVADYILANNWVKQNTFANYDTIEFDKTSMCYLLKRKQPIVWSEQEKYDTLLVEGNNEYFEFIPGLDAAKYHGYPFCFDIRFKVVSAKFPLTLALTCDVWDESRNSLVMSTIPLQYIKADVRTGFEFHRKLYIENIPENAKIIKFYFFNKKYAQVKITDLSITLYKADVKYADIP